MPWAAKTVSYVHLVCLLFLVFGWSLPTGWLKYHAISIPIVILQWWLNNDQCVLTQLQRRWEVQSDVQPKAEGNFTRDLFLKVGLDLTDKQLIYIIYSVMILSGSLSIYRLL